MIKHVVLYNAIYDANTYREMSVSRIMHYQSKRSNSNNLRKVAAQCSFWVYSIDSRFGTVQLSRNNDVGI